MLIRLSLSSLLTLALVSSADGRALAQQQPAPAYPPGAYPQQQPAPYPQQPGAYPQQQPQQYPPGAYPSPLAADPNAPPPSPLAADPNAPYPPPGGYPQGYVYEQPPQLVSSIEGALQLSLGTYFMRYTSGSREFDNMIPEESSTELLWGLSEYSSVTLEGGYGITDRLLIGGVLQLGGTSTSQEFEGSPEAEGSAFDLLLGPKAEFHFLPTSKFNPYAGGVLGIASHSDDVFSHLMFNMQIRAGLRCFVTESLSIDPSLVFAFGIGGGSAEFPTVPGESDYSISGIRIGLALNISGWLR